MLAIGFYLSNDMRQLVAELEEILSFPNPWQVLSTALGSLSCAINTLPGL